MISDMNVLYEAFLSSMNGSSWKEEPQKFEIDFLSQITLLKQEIVERTYKTLSESEFTIHERGKIRYIHGGRMRDRVIRHALCDDVLAPALQPYLIYNNGASQTGKGVDFARKQFEKDLHNYWLEHRNNDGWVGFVDLSKFYDNIPHQKVLEMIAPKIDPEAAWLLKEIVSNFRVDVSYMGEDEYKRCMDEKFDSISYYSSVPHDKRTGEKFMEKSVNIGDQTSQNIGVFYPTKIDNYSTIVRGFRKYGRYMDDIYMIHESQDFIKETISGIREQAEKLGLFINEKKTRVCRMSQSFTYLQVRYFVTDTGRVVKRINPSAVTRERRKLKAYRRLMEKGEMQYPDIEQAYKSWMGAFSKIMSKKQIRNLQTLFKELYGKEPRWKK